jgi:hypothetical protein
MRSKLKKEARMGSLIEPTAWNRVPIGRREKVFAEVSEILYHLYPEAIQETGSKEGLDLWTLMQELRKRLQISIKDEVRS